MVMCARQNTGLSTQQVSYPDAMSLFLLLALSFLEPVLDRRRSTLAHIHTPTPGQDNPTDLTDFAQCRWGLTASAICHRTLVLPLSLVLGSHAEQEIFLRFVLPGLASLAVDLPPYPCERFIIRQSFCALLEAVECFCGSRKLLSRSLTRKAFFFHSIFLHRRVILTNRRHADLFHRLQTKESRCLTSRWLSATTAARIL